VGSWSKSFAKLERMPTDDRAQDGAGLTDHRFWELKPGTTPGLLC
jgi:hypothetical protein